MTDRVIRYLFIVVVSTITANGIIAQPTFVDNQRSFYKLSEIFSQREDSLKTEFRNKKISWPPKALYIRSFKYDQLMEIWVRGDEKKPYHLFKTYPICIKSGTLGPKRKEGDLQIPEGFYYINDFNPNSNYHLSLGLNYPNASDAVLSDSLHPGGEIYIHGNCVSVGCIAITDLPIEELYILASYARAAGQDFIPVHVFPVKFDEKASRDYLQRITRNNSVYNKFTLNLKEAFDYFETNKQLPVIMVGQSGQYIIN